MRDLTSFYSVSYTHLDVYKRQLDMQVKLLRALQESEVDPIGSKRPIKVDVRIVAATNKDLARLVQEGRFREDLFLSLIHI